MLESDCYDHVFQISGVILRFISRCVAGGRVMTNSKEMCHVEKKLLIWDLVHFAPVLCMSWVAF